MDEHLAINKPLTELVERNEKIVFSAKDITTQSRLVGKLRYFWCWIVVSFLVAVFIPILVLIFRFKKNREGYFNWCDWGARIWIRSCGARVKVFGQENLEEKESYVFISNHRSYLDTATLYAYSGRRMGLVAKKELLKVPIFNVGMKYANVIAIDRTNPTKAKESMQKARKVMDDGYSFGVFAEGTRAYPNELFPFKKGGFHLALQTGAPIVPVAIKNTDWMMGKKSGVAFAGTIEVVLLPPIETKDLKAEDLTRLLKQTRLAIAEELNNGQLSVVSGE
jgi:1-acyl-sn-glycerol-3-phosphate acyltransferase